MREAMVMCKLGSIQGYGLGRRISITQNSFESHIMIWYLGVVA